tara:strand:+ start:1812 stop:2039 length:228 start_codon:yes stop_codon:yes gene_type:complete
MSLDEIELRMPEICAENPVLKYHIYATINDLNEDEKIEIDNIISGMMFKENMINKMNKEKCVITANFDNDGNLIS